MFEVVLAVLLATTAGLLTVPIFTLLFEVLSAIRGYPDQLDGVPNATNSEITAVVIPAHNEGASLVPTLSDLRPQLGSNDRLIVVADNCSDDTAAIARGEGAEVIERTDPAHLGKAYALAAGIAYLNQAPPDLVMFVDADCRVKPDTLPRLKRACVKSKRPVQACVLMVAPKRCSIDHRLAEFFWRLRNLVRPLGLARLGLPAQLMGTGMIFPWRLIRGATLRHGNLVEDLQLGLDLAEIGCAPLFYPCVVGTSEFPHTKAGTESQRQRWIQGHVRMIVRDLPRRFARAVQEHNWDLLVLILDVAVPPFSMLASIAMVMLIAAVALFLLVGIASPMVVAGINFGALLGAVLLAWTKFGRELISIRDLAAIWRSLLNRLSFYARVYFGSRASSWVRTDRSD
ncbi:Glycosyltransferase, catalytic subunit of cellulose synthase and poly-beta-1,6-N-acetylglucosamine synthase [Bradyrhizobium lablabi]|uniref:Glycosyltransferase, catalytic subunit of cellulose synthase and poly-beta-1,6-N-acetylglucosamine synthase n=1 Tax=Bradyrhizobium lablabi TaxID=722472 RepID=A0A1M7BKT2_9BRAD|nr:glycosyltransferase family 2 protein [Bradyrhizobium lablabi]SHL55554.1 Glycosyltransferase, catalytic subunit of cellulose synthase and poly-beta-1,6-N-acetylglucosamine synthase [Bradyrhizobium lablabi]